MTALPPGFDSAAMLVSAINRHKAAPSSDRAAAIMLDLCITALEGAIADEPLVHFYVRLAQTDAERWHLDPKATEEETIRSHTDDVARLNVVFRMEVSEDFNERCRQVIRKTFTGRLADLRRGFRL